MKNVISQKAMITRLNRKLANENNTRLHVCRSNSKWFHQYGPFYIVNENNFIEAYGIDDLNKLACEVGIMDVTC
jgi:hypothetical protein